MSSLPYGFTQDDAERIAAAVRAVEGSPARPPGRPAGNRQSYNPGIKHCIVTTACGHATAGSPVTPNGAGRATLYTFNGSAYVVMQTGVQIWNDDPVNTIATTTAVKVSYQDGYWFVTWELCP